MFVFCGLTAAGTVPDFYRVPFSFGRRKPPETIFLSEEELQRIIHIEPRYKRQRAMRDMFLFMCFTGLSYVDLKAITYDNIHTDSDGGTWLMGNRIKTGVAYVVKLLPIAIELIEKYRGTDEKKDSPNVSFR
jgi:integrase